MYASRASSTVLGLLVAALLACGGGEAGQGPGPDSSGDHDVPSIPDASAVDSVGDPAGVPEVPSDDVPVPTECLTGVVCAADIDCLQGARCNLSLTPPACQTLYCAEAGQSCDPSAGDALCKLGLFCLATTPPRCATCKPACEGKVCGEDGCGSTCGACGDGTTCTSGGQCVFETTWVQLPGGTYAMGSDDGADDEAPVHDVTLSAFEMTKTETTQAQYQACVDAGVCVAPTQNWDPATKGDVPVSHVEWVQAATYCEWAGGRLCAEAEWEYAARSGGKAQTYPWGDAPATCDNAVVRDGPCADGAQAVCSKPSGNSVQGACDLAGNVSEWVADWYGAYPAAAQTNPTGAAAGTDRVARGGGWVDWGTDARATRRAFYPPINVVGEGIGLRCCR